MRRYGSTALVTGASSGIGASFCRELAQIGFTTIVAVARRAERLEALKTELFERWGSKVVPISIDLAREGAASQLFSQVNAIGLEVDLVVNNAGFGVLGDMESIDISRTTGMVDLNCRAVAEVAALFLPGMKRRRRGAMIITSSVVATVPAPWFAVYSATKAFDLYLGEALYAECKSTGVDVVTVLPGLTKTEFQAGAGLDRQYHSPYRSPEDVVRTALGALGRKAIVVDGALNKLLVHGTRFLPRAMLIWLSRMVMKVELRRE
jgi:short-subunit dehydrogenase